MTEQIEPSSPQVNQSPSDLENPYIDYGGQANAEDSPEYESVPLGDLSPAEIVALHRYAWDVHGERQGANPIVDLIEAKTGRSVYDWVTQEVDKLAKTDIPRLEAIATAFADSQSSKDREELGLQTIFTLTKASPEIGFKLWQRLLRDPSRKVRDQARSMLIDATDGDYSGDEEFQAETGMTRDKAALLFDANERAERGNNIFNLGDVALRRVLGLSEA